MASLVRSFTDKITPEIRNLILILILISLFFKFLELELLCLSSVTKLEFGVGTSSAAAAAFAARYVSLINPTLTHGATCFHRFAVLLRLK
jgi:hypothetical protein